MRDGLRWVRTSEAIRAFVSQYSGCAPRRAVFCTYDLDVERFDAVLFPELTRRGRQFRTVIMADAGALQANLGLGGARRATRYEVAPVRCRHGGVFHPKLVLLTCGRHCLVGLGSANLTAGGLGGNLELMLFVENTNDVGRQLVGGTARFLKRLVQSDAIWLPASASEFVCMTIAGISSASDALIDSLENDLLSQMVADHRKLGRSAAIEEVQILSPWHSGTATPDGLEPSVLGKIRTSFRAPSIKVFTEGSDGRGPDLGYDASVYIRTERRASDSQTTSSDDDPQGDSFFDRRPMRVHAKAYLVRQRHGGGTLFFGSANCTHPALTKSVGQGGNVELLVPTRLRAVEIEQFQNDLKDLFSQAERSFTAHSPRLPAQARGRVLCGQVIARGAGVHLRLEVPEIDAGSVSISATRHSRAVRVQISKGVGLVEDHQALRRLFSENLAGPDPISAGLLWERMDRDAIPFPVSTPVVPQNPGEPEQVLLDLLWEELGVWPSSSDHEMTKSNHDTDEEEDRLEDDDRKTLAGTQHQGLLDRIAVAVSILRRRIRKADLGREYAGNRLELLRRQISRLTISDHLRDTLLKYLDSKH